MFHVLAFDRNGGVWRRGEYWQEDAGEGARVEEFLREQIAASPARFEVPVRATAGGGPVVTVEWESAVRSVGVAYARVGGERAAAYLLMPGVDEVAEEIVAAALETALGVGPGHSMSPAFATVRRTRRRPLMAAFRVGGRMGEGEARAVMAVEQALGQAYFGMVEALGSNRDEAEGRKITT
jgi:hypothetical protein